MIPIEGSSLPSGSDWDFVRRVREAAVQSGLKQAGIVSLMSASEGGTVHVIANVPWCDSPVFIILDYFGLPFTSDRYEAALASVRDGRRGDLFVMNEEDHARLTPDEPIKAALVQTVSGWLLRDAEEFLKNHKQ